MDVDQEKYVIVISGPTAVGKTDLSFELAKRYDAHIYSADSRQVYKEMSIGTAKPSEEELQNIKHHFINHRSVTEGYSVGDYYKEMKSGLAHYFKDHNVAILTGGTGMYINAVTKGLHSYPNVSPDIIENLEQTLAIGGIEMLQHELQECDPEYFAKIDVNNPMRIVRALSVIHETGETFSSFQQQEIHGLPYTYIHILLNREREELYDRINHRVTQMMKAGLLKEVKSLITYRDLKALNTVGYSELMRFIDGEIDIVAAVELIQRNSRRYAKRQLTWFRKYGEWNTFHPDQKEKIISHINTIITKL